MNLFEDLIADLQKENLLDRGNSETLTVGKNLALLGVEQSSSFKEISNFHDVSFIAAPQVKEISLRKYSLNEIESINSVSTNISSPINYNPALLPSAAKPGRKLQKVQIKNKKNGRFCRTCLIKVPHYRFSCKFCGEKIGKGISYYLFILFSIVALLVVTYLLISSKSYI